MMDATERLLRVRVAVANYIRSEGCGCCSNTDQHDEDRDVLGELLFVKKHKDGSGRNFSRHRGKERR